MKLVRNLLSKSERMLLARMSYDVLPNSFAACSRSSLRSTLRQSKMTPGLCSVAGKVDGETVEDKIPLHRRACSDQRALWYMTVPHFRTLFLMLFFFVAAHPSPLCPPLPLPPYPPHTSTTITPYFLLLPFSWQPRVQGAVAAFFDIHHKPHFASRCDLRKECRKLHVPQNRGLPFVRKFPSLKSSSVLPSWIATIQLFAN